MKKKILLAALIAIAFTAFGQNYDSGFKYSLWSNIEAGGAGVFSYDIGSGKKNAGAQLLVTKRIGDNWRIRGEALVDGFIANGFDRLGKGLIGVSFDALPFYVYADYGLNYNPSSRTKLGLASDAGIGLNFNGIYFEGGIGVTNNGEMWKKNAEVKAGYVANLGITEKDRIRKSVDDNMRSTYGDMKSENQLLKTEIQKCQDASDKMQNAAEQMQKMVNSLQAQLNECKTEKEEAEKNCDKKNEFMPIFFAKNSSIVSGREMEKVRIIADALRYTEDEIVVEGFCSISGNDEMNQELSENRAWAVVMALSDLGIDIDRFSRVQGHGKTTTYNGGDSELNQMVVVSKSK